MNTANVTETVEKSKTVSIAPMMDWTDRHFRYFARMISPNIRLYTEMVTTGALLHGDRERFLRFSELEHPIALQLGGSDPADLAVCAKMGEDFGYDEINLNCGCPSDRVQKGRFGACLMAEPQLVAECVAAMQNAVNIPVTVKCRIGIDNNDGEEFLNTFIEVIKQTGCKTFIIHARKAWLSGLSPKENRTKPPINYARVAKMKARHPELNIVINGEIQSAEEAQQHLEVFDGVMIGREAYQNPYLLLTEIEQTIFGNDNPRTREDIARAMIPYSKEQAEKYATPVKSITRHMINLYQHIPGARLWRQALSTLPHQTGADETVIEKALESLERVAKKAA
ncbi:MAG: tRNA dihydrouridine(20/20a) synthase DusA [Alphaproteobacteria bacterium]|nr:tRNA dihydrouridine(20/20a) synthase DusA [Alphaproteobacteria bacterium]MBP7759269.1 tRNA dihydrouridine(20/20a) synthase DusA [Alphaproteobacteria bacterium]MBP7761903.1 tRNA dihydrouridine(20/20a) synthase DusA [Alphaproteobacteria bacterium]MBP7905966.1 tRNA dihydrouridine(20/20a) synthase DusA [Alphaproteobacteria bacterium]